MEILPPRRRGQLGAITAGAGVQGPSGGFSIQASSVAKASSAPAPVKNPVAPKGSVAPPVTPSVSEQVALKQSTSQAAAAKTMPAFSQGGTYSSNQAVVGVKGYVPPPGTPAITQPPALPNSSATVAALAKQIPQTPAQVIQKVLAKDAGIAVPVKGPPAIIPANPPLPKFPPPPVPKPVTNPVVSPSIAPPRPPPFVPPASGGAVNVNATTSSSIPNRMPAPPAPIVTPAVMKTAVEATSAIVGAKIAEQKAINTMVAASQASQAVAKIDSAVAGAVSEAKEKVAEATQKFADLQAKNQKANETLASQTASEDAKAKAQDALRDARDAAALAARQAAEADAKAKQLAVEKAKAEQEQRAIEAAAERAREEANKKTAEAMEKKAEAIDTQRKVDDRMEQARKAIGMAPTEELMTALMSAKAGKGHKDLFPKELAEIAPLIEAELNRRTPASVMPTPAGNNGAGYQAAPPPSTTPPPSAEAAPQLITAAQMITAQPQPSSGMSGTTIALGLGALGLLVYAASRRKTSLSDVPLIAELDEDEE